MEELRQLLAFQRKIEREIHLVTLHINATELQQTDYELERIFLENRLKDIKTRILEIE